MSTPEMSVRDRIRANTLSTKKAKRIEIEFFGEKIEIVQPKLGDIVKARDEENREAAVIETLINNAVVPGTDTRVFEDADAATLREMPFGADFLRVSKAFEELTEVNFLDKSATSKTTR
jgi:hypothetical protein